MSATTETQKAKQRPFEIDEKAGSAGLCLERYKKLLRQYQDRFFLSLNGSGFSASCDLSADDLRELRRWINAEIGEDEE